MVRVASCCFETVLDHDPLMPLSQARRRGGETRGTSIIMIGPIPAPHRALRLQRGARAQLCW